MVKTMYTHPWRWSFLIACMVLMSACNAGATPPASTPIPTVLGFTADTTPEPTVEPTLVTAIPVESDADPQTQHLLVATSGNVQFQRFGWEDGLSDRAHAGMALTEVDRIVVPDGGGADILCDNFTVTPAPRGTNSIDTICTQPTKQLGDRDGQQSSFPRGDDGLFIISPRATNLLALPAVLRWRDTGAEQYRVRIYDMEESESVWVKEDIPESMVAFPSDLTLIPERRYVLFVDDGELFSEDLDSTIDLSFRLLSHDAAAAVRQDVATIEQQMTESDRANDEDVIAFAIAQRYLAENLMSDAIQTLEERVDADSQSPYIYLMLGDLYNRIELARLSEPYYRTSEDLIAPDMSLEWQMQVAIGLGNVTLLNNQRDEAVTYFTTAHDLATELGDDQWINYLDDLLQVL